MTKVIPVKTMLAAVLLPTLPLAAQGTDPIPLPLRLQVQVAPGSLGVSCRAEDEAVPGFAIVVASLSGRMVNLPGLPSLLLPEVVLVVGPLAGGLHWKAPFTPVPFPLHFQAAGLVGGEPALSERVTLRGSAAKARGPRPAA